MQKIISFQLTRLAIAAACAAMLAACGGSNSNSSNSNNSSKPVDKENTPPVLPVAKTPVEEQLEGLELLAQDADKISYNLTLSIGDTWRLDIKTVEKTYEMKVVQTAFSEENVHLKKISSGKLSKNYSVESSKISAENGDWEINVDQKSSSVTGKVFAFDNKKIMVGGKEVQPEVTGTAYEVPADLARFKGTYFVMASMRNAENRIAPFGYGGQMRVADDGKSYDLCTNGIFDANGNCVAASFDETARQSTFQLERDATTGLVNVSNEEGPQGVMSFLANPLGGYTLMHDYLGNDREGILLTGVMYAARSFALESGDLDGTWKCKDAFTPGWTPTITIKGDQSTIVSADYNATENLAYNRFGNGAGKFHEVPGIVESVPIGKPNEGAIFMPISDKTFVMEEAANEGSLGICTRS